MPAPGNVPREPDAEEGRQPAPARLRCTWQTASSLPYFANLKVMRSVLGVLREELAAAGGGLLAYVFLEDCLAFVAEGPAPGLAAALEKARARSGTAFAASDRKALWGEARQADVCGLGREEVLRPLRGLPVERGLAQDLSDYPWAGGIWLVSGS